MFRSIVTCEAANRREHAASRAQSLDPAHPHGPKLATKGG
jgi:hypothetical protein